jgi:hypothetical protein
LLRLRLLRILTTNRRIAQKMRRRSLPACAPPVYLRGRAAHLAAPSCALWRRRQAKREAGGGRGNIA